MWKNKKKEGGEFLMFRKTFNKKLISTMVAVATVFSLMATPAFAAADSGVAITGGNLSGGVLLSRPSPALLWMVHKKHQRPIGPLPMLLILEKQVMAGRWYLCSHSLRSIILKLLNMWLRGNALATSSVKVTAVPVVSDADPAGRT